MADNKKNESLSVAEINSKIGELEKEIIQNRFQLFAKQLTKVSLIKKARKEKPKRASDSEMFCQSAA
jgi:ribosomal protein L29